MTTRAAGIEIVMLNAAMLKTTVCRHWSRGHCRFGKGCGFAHGGGELRKPLKTALCRHFEQGRCRKGDHCGFAHGAEELGTPQPELLTIDSQEPLDPLAASLPASADDATPNKILVLSLKKKVWRYCTILDEDELNIKVHYDGYSNAFDEWLPVDSNRIAAVGSIASVAEQPTVDSKVIVLSRRKRIWRECTVVESEADKIKVHYDGYNDDYDEWILRSSDRLRIYDSTGEKKTACPLIGKTAGNKVQHQHKQGKPSLKEKLLSVVTVSGSASVSAPSETESCVVNPHMHVPEDLYIFCSHPTGMQAEGHYTLQVGKTINKMPVWECVGTTKLIYSSQRGAWMVGVRDWVAKNNGWLSCKQQHYGSMPHSVGNWRSYLTPADPWMGCDAVVTLTPERPTPSPSASVPDTFSESGLTPAWSATPPVYAGIPSPTAFTYQNNGSFSSSVITGSGTGPIMGCNATGGLSPSVLQQSVSSAGSLNIGPTRHDPYAF